MRECACECNHRISGPSLLSHTDKCEKDGPVKGDERECMGVQPSHFRPKSLTAHCQVRGRRASQRWWESVHVSAIIAFRAQVADHTLTSVGEMSHLKVAKVSACECSHRSSGPSLLPHTDKCEGDAPDNGGERVCM